MKRIVICSDGTWNTPDGAALTNVTRIARAVLPTAPDGTAQVVFYDAGVGTEGSRLWRLLGGVSGKGLEKNIRDCYRFLVHNYEEGDEIYLFGFSRGAYTVRSLAGMVRNCGVLKKQDAEEQFQNAYRLYRGRDAPPGSGEAAGFRAAYSREAEITFIGVWDTVGSLGIPLRYLGKLTAGRHKFHDVELSGIVKRACHALAIDEKRRPFSASLWGDKQKPGQTVEQVWFAGVHSDIGGSSGDPFLGNPPYEWMKDGASKSGLVFDETDGLPATGPSLAPGRGQGLWSLLPSHVRPIGRDETQSVHPTARDRYETMASYKPKNLAEYLDGPEPCIYRENGNC